MESRKWKTVAVVLALSAAAWAVEWVPDGQPPRESPSEAREPQEPKAAIAWEPSYQAALTRARKENKPVLIEFFTTWQHWCQVFEEKTLSDPDVAKLAREFVCVRLNEKNEQKLVDKYHVTGYPTIVFLSPRGDEAYRIIGFLAPGPFRSEVQEIAKGRNPNEEFEKLRKSDPQTFRPLIQLGVGYMRRQQWDKAIDAYERALKVSPGMNSKETEEVVYSLAQLYDLRGKPQKAEPLLRELLGTDGADKAKVHHMLGQTCLSLKRPDEAIEHFRAERDLAEDDQQRESIDRLIEFVQRAAAKTK